MTIYTRFQSTARRLLDRFQQGKISLVRVTYTPPPSGLDWDPAVKSEVTTPLKAVARGVGNNFNADSGLKVGDLSVIYSDDVKAEPGDYLEVDGIRFAIIAVENVPAAGTRVATRVTVRRP